MTADFPSRVPGPIRRALEMAAAVAHARLLEEHRVCALEVVERAKEDLPVDRIVEIYLRLHQLDGEDATLLRQRLLVTVGQHRRLAEVVIGGPEDEDAGGTFETPRKVLGRVRRRLRGRVNPELRQWIELHTGGTEMRLLRIHTDEAVGFVRALAGVLTSASAVELYQKHLKVRSSLGEVLYLMVLERLGGAEPARSEAAPVRSERPAAPAADAPSQRAHPRGTRNRLRVIDEAV